MKAIYRITVRARTGDVVEQETVESFAALRGMVETFTDWFPPRDGYKLTVKEAEVETTESSDPPHLPSEAILV